MLTVDNIAEFTRRGGFDCGNSAYAYCKTTCCENWCVLDVEMDDLYVDGDDLGKRVSLLRARTDPEIPCPFCGVSDWRPMLVEDLEGLPQAWVWATHSPEQGRMLRATPK